MATRKRKKTVKKIKFQLTRSGIFGIAVVCFCIFLWMFLVGVWAGQSLLYPPVKSSTLSSGLSGGGEGHQVLEIIQLEATKKKKIIRH